MSVLPFDVFKVPTRSCDRYKKDYLDNEIQRQKREIQKCIKVESVRFEDVNGILENG